MNLLTLAEKKVMAGNAYTAEDFDPIIRVLSSRGAEIERFITAIVPLDNAIKDGFEDMVNNKSLHNKILVEVHGEN